MDALNLLLNRHSQPKLTAPAPSQEALNQILQAGDRAPDHAGLKPWELIVCQGEGLKKLGSIFEQSALKNNLPENDIKRAPLLPLRAPMVIVVIMRYQQHDKVPRVEQIASVACAVVSMQMAAVALGYQGMWRTGRYAHCSSVKNALVLQEKDEIVGFLYLGTAENEKLPMPPSDIGSHVSYWR
ncbi:NAD(P)H nitroreductase [Alteromonas sp. 5E99-2]|uniref:NAD(P)H nitroreductase n=1 Tax=Alteromonas sp. 5E99-2 TaxID=2817683 RepID=UPI001A97F6B9|nr:NAD(P)H nitroreductase [Alteromonas sp. 5E99-2]MBO1256227.1 NAD(P)H nitroreductase [Alteromonas sp. 5E99-2]